MDKEDHLMKYVLRRILSIVLLAALCLGSVYAYAEEDAWNCRDCGAANTGNFCIKCGAKRPEEIICPECGTRYTPDSGAMFCGNCGTKLQQGAVYAIRYEGEGFDTPEAAVTCYMEGFKNLNFDQVLGAFAWETQIEHMSFETYYERIRSYSPASYPRMPSVNDFMVSANINVLRYNQVTGIYRALESFILGEDAPNGMNLTFKDPEDIAAFLQKFDNGRIDELTQMSNIRFLDPDAVTEGKFSLEINRENFAKQTAFYNADEVVNLVGVADVGDSEIFFCCPTVARYGGKWYLVSIGSYTSMIMGISVNYQAFACGKGSVEDLFK